jgi:hypothetical protein
MRMCAPARGIRLFRHSGTNVALPPDMILPSRDILRVVKTIALTPRGEIGVVRCTDGTYGLLWDGRLVESLDWNSDRMDECVTFVERLAASLNMAHAMPSTHTSHAQAA